MARKQAECNFLLKKAISTFFCRPPPPAPPPISSISYMFCATWLPPLPSEYLLLVFLNSCTLAARAPPPFLPLQRDKFTTGCSTVPHVTFRGRDCLSLSPLRGRALSFYLRVLYVLHMVQTINTHDQLKAPRTHLRIIVIVSQMRSLRPSSQ